jgi:hypothetical protein
MTRKTLLCVFICLFVGGQHSPANALSAYQNLSQSQPKQPAPKQPVLIVDTDDDCRLFVDDEDKGVMTPAHSQRFSVNLGEHILKCTVESIPDLVWRKAVDVKDSSQVAVVISLKALHVQYDQAATKAKNQLAEAEAEQQQREAARVAVPQQIADLVRGTWAHSWSYTIVEGYPQTRKVFYEFGPLDGGLIQVTVGYEFFKNRFTVIPTAPNLLISEEGPVCWIARIINGHNRGQVKPGATVDAQGWGECAEKYRKPFGRTEITIIDKNHLLERVGHEDPIRLIRMN